MFEAIRNLWLVWKQIPSEGSWLKRGFRYFGFVMAIGYTMLQYGPWLIPRWAAPYVGYLLVAVFASICVAAIWRDYLPEKFTFRSADYKRSYFKEPLLAAAGFGTLTFFACMFITAGPEWDAEMTRAEFWELSLDKARSACFPAGIIVCYVLLTTIPRRLKQKQPQDQYVDGREYLGKARNKYYLRWWRWQRNPFKRVRTRSEIRAGLPNVPRQRNFLREWTWIAIYRWRIGTKAPFIIPCVLIAVAAVSLLFVRFSLPESIVVISTIAFVGFCAGETTREFVLLVVVTISTLAVVVATHPPEYSGPSQRQVRLANLESRRDWISGLEFLSPWDRAARFEENRRNQRQFFKRVREWKEDVLANIQDTIAAVEADSGNDAQPLEPWRSKEERKIHKRMRFHQRLLEITSFKRQIFSDDRPRKEWETSELLWSNAIEKDKESLSRVGDERIREMMATYWRSPNSFTTTHLSELREIASEALAEKPLNIPLYLVLFRIHRSSLPVVQLGTNGTGAIVVVLLLLWASTIRHRLWLWESGTPCYAKPNRSIYKIGMLLTLQQSPEYRGDNES